MFDLSTYFIKVTKMFDIKIKFSLSSFIVFYIKISDLRIL